MATGASYRCGPPRGHHVAAQPQRRYAPRLLVEFVRSSRFPCRDGCRCFWLLSHRWHELLLIRTTSGRRVPRIIMLTRARCLNYRILDLNLRRRRRCFLLLRPVYFIDLAPPPPPVFLHVLPVPVYVPVPAAGSIHRATFLAAAQQLHLQQRSQGRHQQHDQYGYGDQSGRADADDLAAGSIARVPTARNFEGPQPPGAQPPPAGAKSSPGAGVAAAGIAGAGAAALLAPLLPPSVAPKAVPVQNTTPSSTPAPGSTPPGVGGVPAGGVEPGA